MKSLTVCVSTSHQNTRGYMRRPNDCDLDLAAAFAARLRERAAV